MFRGAVIPRPDGPDKRRVCAGQEKSMSITIGICNRIHPALADPVCCAQVKEAGITALYLDCRLSEADASLASPDIRTRWGEEAARSGVRLAGITVSEVLRQPMTAAPGTESRTAAERAIALAIEYASAMGIPRVIIPSLGASAVRDVDDLRHTARCLRMACALAASKNMLVAMENTLAADEVHSLLAAVGYPNLRVMPDCSGPDLLPKDLLALAEGEVCVRVMPPAADGAFAGLQRAGFAGCVFLATNQQAGPDRATLFADIRRDVAALRAVWQAC